MTEPRPPAPLPPQLRALLATYREAEGIPPQVEARIWSVVGADEVPAAELDASSIETADDEAPPRVSQRTIGWIGFGMAAAAVLVAAWTLGGQRAQRQHIDETPGSAVMQGEGSTPSAKARTETRSPMARPTESESPAAVVEPEPEASAPVVEPSAPTRDEPLREGTRRAPPRPRSPEPPAAPEPSSLSAERDLVARAWRSLAHGDEVAALATAAEHERRFGTGLLAPEREAIEVIARCRRGDADGPERAAAFHRAHPRSPLAGRVDEACGSSGEEK